MWSVLLLLGLSLSSIQCGKKNVLQVKEISLKDLENSIAHHPAHLMEHGVDRNFILPEEDPHGGHGNMEARLQEEDLKAFLKTYGARRKNRKNHSRSSKDRAQRGSRKSRERYRRETLSKQSRQIVDLVGQKGNIRRKRFFGTWMLWEKGVVPYSFGNASAIERTAAKSAMELFHLYTCVRFIELDGTDNFHQRHGLSHQDSLVFVTSGNSGCWSKVGQKGSGPQEISACDKTLTAIHELSHALGAFHEHESYDRTGNVEANMGNIQEGYHKNFYQHDPAYRSFFNVDSYDMQSLMHYEPYDFSGNGLPTLDPLYHDFADPADDYWLLMKETSKVYKCWDNKCSGVTLTCANEGYGAYYNNTCQCTCPAGLDPSQQCNAVTSKDCGGIIELTQSKPSHVIRSPDLFSSEAVTCTWVFKSSGRIKLDVMEMNLEGDDDGCRETLQIRRNLLGQSGATYCGNGFEKSIFSLGNYLAITLVSVPSVSADLIASAEALFATESCYNWNDRGETYNGDLDRSEDYHKCIDWSEATTCNHSPFFISGDLKADYSGSGCRNPGGVLHRPWCYTDVRPSSCTIRYCEPCQIGHVYDVYDNCEDILRKYPDYCADEEASHGCRKTCDLDVPIIVTGKCAPAPEILGANLIGIPALSYEIGAAVTYQCIAQPDKRSSRFCLSTGEWSQLAAVCDECLDQLSTCEKMLQRNHTMCSTTPAFSNKYCAATCGKCGTPATCNVQSAIPNSNTELLTQSSTINQGEFAQYACVDGYFLKSGDMEMVCMSDGTMYGEMLECSTTNMDNTPVSELEVVQLPHVFMYGWAFIGSNSYTRITRAGALKTWYFYCVSPGAVKLVVFRNTANGILVVGVTETECDANRLNVHHLKDGLSEIHVQVGDYIGAVDLEGQSLTFTTCDDNSDQSYVVAMSDPSLLKDGSEFEFQGLQYCAYASLNADIGPIRKTKYRLVDYILNIQ